MDLFPKGHEYDYYVEIKSKGWPVFLRKAPIRVAENLDVGIFYDPTEAKPKNRIEFEKLDDESNNQREKADVVLHWDEKESLLSAKRNSKCLTPVYYSSHLNDGDKKILDEDAEADIYRFEDLYQQLKRERHNIEFDPNDTMVRFGKKCDERAVCVVLRSRTAACLYQTFV